MYLVRVATCTVIIHQEDSSKHPAEGYSAMPQNTTRDSFEWCENHTKRPNAEFRERWKFVKCKGPSTTLAQVSKACEERKLSWKVSPKPPSPPQPPFRRDPQPIEKERWWEPPGDSPHFPPSLPATMPLPVSTTSPAMFLLWEANWLYRLL